MHPRRVWFSALRAGDHVASADVDLTIKDEMQARLGCCHSREWGRLRKRKIKHAKA
ncbi:protein of unknown function [Ectopseudomonas oleovorans]|nr:protein of unknown function [Pseudomonas oleovorans]